MIASQQQTAIAFYDWCTINNYVFNKRKLYKEDEANSNASQYFTTSEIWYRFEGFMGTPQWGQFIETGDKQFLKDNRYE